jgi:hypothetical protein
MILDRARLDSEYATFHIGYSEFCFLANAIVPVFFYYASTINNILFFRNNPCAGISFERLTDILRVGDDGLLASIFQEPYDGLDLWSHRALCKMSTFSQVLLGLRQGHLIDPSLIGLPKSRATFSTAVEIRRRSAWISCANKLLAKSLSITAAVPTYWPSPLSITGIPPPPTVMTTTPALMRA